jgi:mRNA degradation ribonuclease J1/J2
MAEGTHRSLALAENDIVVFSSRVIPGNQKAISALKNRLVLKNVQIIDQKDDSHVSGHPCRDELALMYSWLQPQSVIPVHGEDRHILEHYTFALSQGIPHAVRPHNGQLFHITAKDGPLHVGNVATGRLALDGKRLVEDEGPVMTERRRLCETGFLVVVATVAMEKRKVVSCRSLSRGVFEHTDEQKEWDTLIRKAITDTVHQQSALAEDGGKARGQSTTHRGPEGSKGKRDSVNQATVALSEASEKSLYHLFKTNLKIRPVIQVHITWI